MKRLFFIVLCALTTSLTILVAQPSDANAGKVWVSGNFLFISSPYRGIQVMDNSNSRKPQTVGFVAIPNNIDFAVFENVMYANHYDDLVAFDWEAYIEDSELVELARFKGLFPKYAQQKDLVAMGIGIIDSRNSPPINIGGSMSCFSFDNPKSPVYLYATNGHQIHVVDVQNKEKPKQGTSVTITNGEVETIFVNNERLYIGMPDGMRVFSLDNPQAPREVGEYKHMVGCDPVITQGNLAYVTVRSGSTCNSKFEVNQLHIVNVDNPTACTLESSFQLTNPHGLGIDGNILFICDGTDGLKVLDVSNPKGVRLLGSTKTAGVAYDLIVQSAKRQLIVISGDNIIQYQYSATGSLTRMSEFKLEY